MQGSEKLFTMLKDIDPKKPYGTKLFDSLARLTVSVAVEAVCLRYEPLSTLVHTKTIQVYMLERPLNDTAYPGQWHCPGSVLRPGEEITDVFERLSNIEFGENLKSWKFINNVNYAYEARGHFLSLVYLCSLRENTSQRGKWFNLHELPSRTVEHHKRIIIPVAVGPFLAENALIY